jgi:hypothetical protein
MRSLCAARLARAERAAVGCFAANEALQFGKRLDRASCGRHWKRHGNDVIALVGNESIVGQKARAGQPQQRRCHGGLACPTGSADDHSRAADINTGRVEDDATSVFVRAQHGLPHEPDRVAMRALGAAMGEQVDVVPLHGHGVRARLVFHSVRGDDVAAAAGRLAVLLHQQSGSRLDGACVRRARDRLADLARGRIVGALGQCFAISGHRVGEHPLASCRPIVYNWCTTLRWPEPHVRFTGERSLGSAGWCEHLTDPDSTTGVPVNAPARP